MKLGMVGPKSRFRRRSLTNHHQKLDTICSNLKYYLENVLIWFQANTLKANPSKFQFMILGG